MNYKVNLFETEIVRYTWIVEANNQAEAIAKAKSGDGGLLGKNFISGEITDQESIEEWEE